MLGHLITIGLSIIPVTIIYYFFWKRYRRRNNDLRGLLVRKKDEKIRAAAATGLFYVCAYDFMLGLTISGVTTSLLTMLMIVGVGGAFIGTWLTINS